MGNCPILIVFQLNEYPIHDPTTSYIIQYQYDSVNVGGFIFSSGFAFRCVMSLKSYSVDNKAIYNKVPPISDDFQKKYSYDKYYKNLLHAYNHTCKGNCPTF